MILDIFREGKREEGKVDFRKGMILGPRKIPIDPERKLIINIRPILIGIIAKLKIDQTSKEEIEVIISPDKIDKVDGTQIDSKEMMTVVNPANIEANTDKGTTIVINVINATNVINVTNGTVSLVSHNPVTLLVKRHPPNLNKTKNID